MLCYTPWLRRDCKMAGKKAAIICTCGAKMKRIYMKIDSKFQGIGQGCLHCNRKTWNNKTHDTAMSAAWAVLKKGETESDWTDTLRRGGN